jgi:hypothetical protein|tara:strand:+ start:484 stop:1743 length:1260 start_codon:yes stop_codon:yes gene_type:complete
MKITKKKIFFFITTILIISIFLINLKNNYYLRQNILKIFPDKYAVILKIVFGDQKYVLQNLNDYGTKFLPETQFINLNFHKIKIKNTIGKIAGYKKDLKSKRFSFYINVFSDKIILASKNKLLYLDIDKLYQKEIFAEVFIDNLIEDIDIKDTIINDNEIYISYTKINKKKNCSNLILSKAIINFKELEFNEIIQFDECANNIQAGKIEILDKNKILITTAGDILALKEFDPKPQDDNSIFGKIILIDEVKKSYEIFSKGHRNALGLLYDKKNNIILSTENGPRGGDEINLIKFGKNYGWDIASYGETYYSRIKKYKKNHKDYGFEEPIYSFIPSIGISEIISLDNNFSEQWINNYLIASLNSNHLYRIKIGEQKNNLIYLEKIYIGERIRDIYYLKSQKIILLALENSGSIGILSLKN